MVKRFAEIQPDPAIDRVLARLDARRVAKRKARNAQSSARSKARFAERRALDAAQLREGVIRRLTCEPILALAGWRVLVARMEPDTWYTLAEIKAIMPEYQYGSLKAWLWQVLRSLGMLQRAPNPDFDPGRAGKYARYLYCLDGSALAMRGAWRDVLGMDDECSLE